MSRVRYVITQQGEEESFDRLRLVRSILAAIRAAKHDDESVADMIAPMVEIALARAFQDQPPTIDDVAYYVEQGLRAIDGMEAVADAYLTRRTNNAELEPTARRGFSQRASRRPSNLSLPGWDPSRVEAMLVREYGLALGDAQTLAEAVAKRLEGLALKRCSAGLLRALLDAELEEQGLTAQGVPVSQAALSLYDIDQAVFPIDEQSNAPTAAVPEELGEWVQSEVLRGYALARVHSASVAEAVSEERFKLSYLDAPAHAASLRFGLAAAGEAGMGCGLETFFPDPAAGGEAVLDRIAEVASALCGLRAGAIELQGIDSAWARHAGSSVQTAALAQGLVARLALLKPSQPIVLGLDALAPGDGAGGSLRLASALVDLVGAGASRARLAIKLCLHVRSDAIQQREGFALLERASARALSDGGIMLRVLPPQSQSQRTLFGASRSSLRGVEATLAHVSLDLQERWHALKHERGVAAPNHGHLFASLDQDLETMVLGLLERVSYLRRFHSRQDVQVPCLTSAIGRMLAEGVSCVQLDLLGLSEIAPMLAEGPRDLDDLSRQMQTVLSYVAFKLESLAGQQNIRAVIGDGREHDARRSAHMRAASAGERGFSVPDPGALWQERHDQEAKLQRLAPAATLLLSAKEQGLSHRALLQYLMHQARVGEASGLRIGFAVPLRHCTACGNAAPEHVHICPACGGDAWDSPSAQRTLFDRWEPSERASDERDVQSQPSGRYTIL